MEILTKERQVLQANQRLGRAVQGGMQFIIDETVTSTIKHSAAIEDLKWMLRMLLTGEFSINLDPKNPGRQSLVPVGDNKDKDDLSLEETPGKAN